jgi:hypothetical protein
MRYAPDIGAIFGLAAAEPETDDFEILAEALDGITQ